MVGNSAMPGSGSPLLRRRSFLGGAATLGAVGLVGGLAACSESSSPAGAAKGTKTLSVGVFQNPDSLDPGQTGLVTVSQVLYAVFDTLMW